MPALVARLLPVAVIVLILVWFVQELNNLDKEQKNLENHWLWGRLGLFRFIRLTTRRTQRMILYLLRVAVFLVLLGGIAYFFSSW